MPRGIANSKKKMPSKSMSKSGKGMQAAADEMPIDLDALKSEYGRKSTTTRTAARRASASPARSRAKSGAAARAAKPAAKPAKRASARGGKTAAAGRTAKNAKKRGRSGK